MTNYSDVYVKCPFYLGMEASGKYSSIICEGVCARNILKLQFSHKNERDAYKAEHCDSDYKKCMVNEMLNQKYE